MKKLIYLLIIISLTTCKAQKTSTMEQEIIIPQVTKEFEVFDNETFKKNKKNGEYEFILEDGTKVRQVSGENNYIQYIMPSPPELFYTYGEYYKSGNIKVYVKYFPRDFDKLKKEYNEKGELVEEINYDIPYKFTFEELLELIKKRKDTIDLFDKNTTIGRTSDVNGTFWYVTYKKEPKRRERIKVDNIRRSFITHSLLT